MRLILLPLLWSCADPCLQATAWSDPTGCYAHDGSVQSGQRPGEDSGAVDLPADSGDAGQTDGGGDGEGGGDGGDVSDGGDGGEGLILGDPILTVARQGDDPAEAVGGDKTEWVDGALLGGGYGLTVGYRGWQVLELDAAAPVARQAARSGYKVAADGGLAAITTRSGEVMLLDVSDPLRPVARPSLLLEDDAVDEDVAVDAGRILVGWSTAGGRLYDATGSLLTTLPADHAFAVGLSGDRAVITDGADLVLFDIGAPGAPVELDRTRLRGEGRDLDFDGQRVAVGLGGRGVDLFHIEGDVFIFDGDLDIPGAALGLALDGDRLWVATWETVALAWLGEGGPFVLGHEDVGQSAMGIDAADGRAMVADWTYVSLLKAVPGVAGPEITAPERLYQVDPGEPLRLPLRNGGPMTLTVAFDAPAGWIFEPAQPSLAPGTSLNVVVRPPAGEPAAASVQILSNDPDEAVLDLALLLPEADIGSQHPDLSLPGIQVPGAIAEGYDLGEQRGKVVLLVYWALF